MKTRHLFIIGFLAFSLIFGGVIPVVQAASLGSTEVVVSPPEGGNVLPGGGDTSETFKDSLIFKNIIPFLISYTIGLAIARSVGAVVWGGYLYLTAFGETEKHDKGRKTITYALIGLTLSLTAY